MTGVFYRQFFGITGSAFVVTPLGAVALGPLARIPFFGPRLFDQSPLVYIAFLLVPIFALVIRAPATDCACAPRGSVPRRPTRWGSAYIGCRWQALMAAGVLTGLGGAFLTLAYASTFVEGISAGRGFVALAVVILGRWNAWGCAAASMLFGAAMALQFGLQALGTAVPYQLFLALPYALTLMVLAGFGGQADAPSALGEPYVRP